ncbi:hypothetical protein SMKC058_23890 [Serratia marcescens]|nr:hypothetical protein SMKC058_23890 [Serratia marcescens]
MLVNRGTVSYKSDFVNALFALKQTWCNVCQVT